MAIKNKKYDKNTPQVGDLLIAGKVEKMYFYIVEEGQSEVDVRYGQSGQTITEHLPAFIIRADGDDIYLRFPLTGHTHKESKRRLRFNIKRREYHLQKAYKKRKRNDK